MPEDSSERMKQMLQLFAFILLLPFLTFAMGFLAGVGKGIRQLREQRWRYFVPTWTSIAEFSQIAAFALFFLGPLLFRPEAFKGPPMPVIFLWAVAFVVVALGVPISIERIGEWTGREKVFAFAEVENGD